ncbi:NAD-dependent epimerase/dehydratase family protein [Desulfovibrio sp. OttesenSCG-928-M14]|nr:NAD-dependent epimerase/dehydratase family protein [Desulfovibrio sp. OttesenSCG-928-M14]
MKWAITGGCGFIGCNVLKFLLGHEHSVRVLDNLSAGGKDRLKTIAPVHSFQATTSWPPLRTIELCVADIADAGALKQFMYGADVVLHLAANTGVPKSVQEPVADFEANCRGTFNCLEAARAAGVRRFIFASSGAPTGMCMPPVTETTVARPLSPYGAGKLAGEGYCSAYFQSYGLETVVLRFSNVYGPLSDQKRSVVAKFIRQALQGETWKIYGDGSQTRDFIYIDDLVSAIYAAAIAKDVGGEVFQIATGVKTSLNELTNMLRQMLEGQGGSAPAIEHAAPLQGEIINNYADPAKAHAYLDWRHSVSLQAGLERTIRWFIQSHQALLHK